MKPFDDQIREQIKFYELITPSEKISRSELLKLAKASPQEKKSDLYEQPHPFRFQPPMNSM